MCRRRWEHRRQVLDRLSAAICDERPDQILITGDLAHIGLPEEIRAVREWLQALGPAESVFLVPGNHDVYARDSWPVVRCEWGDYLHLNHSADNTRVFATASASSAMIDQPASYRILDFAQETHDWRIAMTLKQADSAGGPPRTVSTDCWLHRMQPG